MVDGHWIPKMGDCMAGQETSCYDHSEKAMKLVRGYMVRNTAPLACYLRYLLYGVYIRSGLRPSSHHSSVIATVTLTTK